MSPPLPAIRPLEAHPVEQDGAVRYHLHDPAGYSDHEAWLTPQALFLAAQLDGNRTAAEVATALQGRFGVAVAEAEVEQAVAQLDQVLFLESDRFRAHRQAVDDAFLTAPLRPPVHTAAYEPDPERLPAYLDRLFTADGGPGALPGPPRGAPLAGIVAPHIDLHRGGPIYAHAYKALAEAGRPETCIVLGTCHAGLHHPFACLDKGYDTPLGPVAVDGELAAAVRATCPWAFDEAIAHRQEHAIEFQALFLRHLFGDGVRILPILVDGLHGCLATGTTPADDRRIHELLDGVAEAVAQLGRSVSHIAAVDLSHVGTHFGDDEPLDGARLAAVEASDQTLLDALCSAPAGAFYDAWAATGDATRVCGAAPLYAFRHLTEASPGDLLAYHQCHTPEENLMVSCAAMVFRAG